MWYLGRTHPPGQARLQPTFLPAGAAHLSTQPSARPAVTRQDLVAVAALLLQHLPHRLTAIAACCLVRLPQHLPRRLTWPR
jgi:hypothetical protein